MPGCLLPVCSFSNYFLYMYVCREFRPRPTFSTHILLTICDTIHTQIIKVLLLFSIVCCVVDS